MICLIIDGDDSSQTQNYQNILSVEILAYRLIVDSLTYCSFATELM